MLPLPIPKSYTDNKELFTVLAKMQHRNPATAEVGFSCTLDELPTFWKTIQARPWRFTERRLAKVFLVSEDVPDFDENWSEINNRKDELVEGYGELGYEVEIWRDTSESLLEMLKGRADHRVFLIHGDEIDGVRCTDHFVSWKEIEDNIGPTGLAHFMSCWSHDAEVSDDDGPYSFRDGIFHARCSAVILCCNEGHHFPGESGSGRIFEIERILWILRRSHEVGLRNAMDDYRTEYCKQSSLGAICGAFLTDHDVAAGNPLWGILD
jgi:hypothetical protein|tara:strand:- start:62 stop:859 length:798 start_codon:yes stop_codon:yes gene_type:complete